MPRHHGSGRPGSDPTDIAELRRLRLAQPDLASAIDLQIELVKLDRRVRSRVPMPALALEVSRVAAQLSSGHPLLRFTDLPLNWSDFRFLFRTIAELMHRADALDEADLRRTETLAREGRALEVLVTQWFTTAVDPASATPPAEAAGLEHIVQMAMRPFLTRCAEVAARLDLSPWTRGCCPLCGGEPEFALITPAAARLLICGRCTTRWHFDALTCPYCGNDDRTQITSFASRDGHYRISACDVCRRYLKAYDARHATRQIMLEVDTIATLPLDAAAMQRGYQG